MSRECYDMDGTNFIKYESNLIGEVLPVWGVVWGWKFFFLLYFVISSSRIMADVVLLKSTYIIYTGTLTIALEGMT